MAAAEPQTRLAAAGPDSVSCASMLLLSSVLALTAASRSAPSAEHAVPSSLPVNASARVVIVGSGFDAGAAAPRCALASGDWDLDDAAKAPVPATIHNSTHASCVPPRMRLRRVGSPHAGPDERHDWHCLRAARVLPPAVRHSVTTALHIRVRGRSACTRPPERGDAQCFC